MVSALPNFIGIMRNLHIVLVMDCSNTNFTLNCESNPAFFKRCAVQWMDCWSRVSMYKVRSSCRPVILTLSIANPSVLVGYHSLLAALPQRPISTST